MAATPLVPWPDRGRQSPTGAHPAPGGVAAAAVPARSLLQPANLQRANPRFVPLCFSVRKNSSAGYKALFLLLPTATLSAGRRRIASLIMPLLEGCWRSLKGLPSQHQSSKFTSKMTVAMACALYAYVKGKQKMHVLFELTCMPLYTASKSAKKRKRQTASWRARRTENTSGETRALVAEGKGCFDDQTLQIC